MNTDPLKSTTFCGCDEGANHLCARHTKEREEKIQLVAGLMERGIAENARIYAEAMDKAEAKFLVERVRPCFHTPIEPLEEDMGARIARLHDEADVTNEADLQDCLEENRRRGIGGAPTRCTILPSGPAERKRFPVASGFMDYFPDAIVAVSNLSYVGNEQHNPGQPLNWNREKSKDEADTMMRHFLQRGTRDSDSVRHSVKVVWRALAMLQKEIEEESK